MANSRGCPHYRFRCEILATQTREHITYREVEETVRTRFREDGKTYSLLQVELIRFKVLIKMITLKQMFAMEISISKV